MDSMKRPGSACFRAFFLCRYLADDKGLELLDQIVAMIGVNFQGDRLGEIQAEDTQDGLAVNYVAANAQVDIIRILVRDVNKILDVLSETELDINCLHFISPLLLHALWA